MSAQPAEPPGEDTSIDVKIEAVILTLMEEQPSEYAALRVLAHRFLVLLPHADRSVSRGYLRGLFSQGARPFAEPTP